MECADIANAALVVIDVQRGLDAPELGERNNPDAEANMLTLIEWWREQSRPVIHVKHNSTEPNSTLQPDLPGNEFKAGFAPLPNEKLFEKTVNSAFIGTTLEDYLLGENIKDVIIVGLTTDHCVSTSVRMAANLGFRVWLVGDATAAFERKYNGVTLTGEQIHTANLASLHNEFCTVVSVDTLLG